MVDAVENVSPEVLFRPIGEYVTDGPKLSKTHAYDAGLDVPSNEDAIVFPGRSKLISTGIKIAIPKGCVGLIRSRSGLACKGIEVGAGVIDATYRGEVKVLLRNFSENPFQIHKGDRIAQLLTMPVELGLYSEVETLSDTVRGENGFGSTGV